ncbi:maleylacetoacetate isomerase [Epibacterium ulvae]|uniref:maleylacetoacetate isomerase n=1 Tax=Epibacterium ulvae TaxID=1156985 RepID=UPI00249259D8|nr:maleylacetoacetate isomerase [Epibacterium ulvae]
MTTLYDYWRSSASYRVRIALGLADMQWNTEIVDLLNADHRSDTHLTRNPQGLVPTLDLDGQMMTQSIAIIEYLDETRDLGLLPKSPMEKAKVRALAYAIAMEIHPICNLNVAKFAVQTSQGAIENKQWMQHFITKGLLAYEQLIPNGTYSYGESVTLADICLMPQIYNANRWDVDLGPMPKIRSVVSQLEKLPAFTSAHPDNSPH